MARPLATAPSITLYSQGKYIWLRYLFRGVKIRKSTGVLSAAAGKKSDDEEVFDKFTLIKARKYFETAHRAVVASGAVVTSEAISTEFDRLQRLGKERVAQEQRQVPARALSPAEEIARLEAQIRKVRQQATPVAQGEEPTGLLRTCLETYAQRNGKNALAKSTQRTFASFINTVTRFRLDACIQDVDNFWLNDFQDWLAAEPSHRTTMNGRLILGETRKNGTIGNYLVKLHSCLKYFLLYDDLLPPGVRVNEKYKRFKSVLRPKPDHVITLEEDEVLALKALGGFKRPNLRKAQLLLLFISSTSLRYSDAITITRKEIEDGYIRKETLKGQRYGTVVHIPLNPISLYVLQTCHYNLSSLELTDDLAVECMQELCSMIPSMQKVVTVVNFSGTEMVSKTAPRYGHIGTHAGRRTYINIMLDYGVPLHVLMSHTGHTNIKTLQVYMQKRRSMKHHTLNIFNIPRQHNMQIIT